MSKVFKLLAFLLVGILTDTITAHAAAPIDVVLNDIVYRINTNEETAECLGFSSSSHAEISISPAVEYDGKSYPVTSIASKAFERTGLTDIVIPSTVISIGTSAFESNRALISITFNEGLKSIEARAFYDCRKLESVTIPNSVTTIGNNAFDICSELKTLVIGNSLKEIGNQVFSGTGITSVKFGSAIESIGWYAFSGCPFTSIELPESLISIGDRAFQGCKLENLIIPQNVTTIGQNAFADCKSLRTATLGKSVNHILSSAFANNSNLVEFNFNDGVETIGSGIFQSCSSLTEIKIPFSISTIPSSAFQKCTGLEKIELTENITSIGEWCFWGCSNLQNVSIKGGIETIPDNCFAYCENLSSFSLPKSVASIGEYAFEHCTNLKDFTFNDKLTTIGKYAFRSCPSLNFEKISPSLIELGVGTFQYCTSLSSIDLPIGVKSLTSWVFSGCTNLKEVHLRQLMNYIGDEAFENCSKLDIVYLEALTPPTLYYSAFSNSYPEYITLHVPVGTEELYRSADNWKKFGNIIGDLKVDIKITGITFNVYYKNIFPLDSFQIEPSITPINATNQVLKWTSSNNEVAIVDENGFVRGISPGDAYIIAETTDGLNISAKCLVNVKIPVREITLNEDTVSIPVGNGFRITATVSPDNADNNNLLWKSSNPAIVSVDQTGYVYALKEGEAIIMVSCADGPKVSSECYVKVIVPVSEIILNHSNVDVLIGNKEDLQVNIMPNNASNKTLIWESLDSSIASVDDGIVTANSIGTTTIIVRSNDGFGAFSECKINVVDDSGIQDIVFDNNTEVKVYSLSGYCLYEGLIKYMNLKTGLYIIRQNGKTKKVKIE